ncbi:MAG: hypothetical protein IJG32_08770, partial [Selenomonadaceae bacterium]|nr:hypothetical protein [Selenomonadaceae bacterium]
PSVNFGEGIFFSDKILDVREFAATQAFIALSYQACNRKRRNKKFHTAPPHLNGMGMVKLPHLLQSLPQLL